MNQNPANIEREYVQSIYSRLAVYQKKDNKPSSPRIWPRVRQFVEAQPVASIILDIGCGEAKYSSPSSFVFGVDTCSEVLVKAVEGKPNVDVGLADAVQLPCRDNSVDAILNVSVLHHLSTIERRNLAIRECARCLRVGGQILLYVWAFEQPNGTFSSQDLLVPWNMHENVINGRIPKVKFHMNSTKEQRIIEASIPISISTNEPQTLSTGLLTPILNKVRTIKDYFPNFLSIGSKNCASTASPSNNIPSAAPLFSFLPKKVELISGIKRWSPMLGKRLSSLLIPVEEQLADELAQTIITESLTEAMATLKEVRFYRFYHVFRKGELDEMLKQIPTLRLISSTYEHGNWSIVAEKVSENYISV